MPITDRAASRSIPTGVRAMVRAAEVEASKLRRLLPRPPGRGRAAVRPGAGGPGRRRHDRRRLRPIGRLAPVLDPGRGRRGARGREPAPRCRCGDRDGARIRREKHAEQQIRRGSAARRRRDRHLGCRRANLHGSHRGGIRHRGPGHHPTGDGQRQCRQHDAGGCPRHHLARPFGRRGGRPRRSRPASWRSTRPRSRPWPWVAARAWRRPAAVFRSTQPRVQHLK